MCSMPEIKHLEVIRNSRNKTDSSSGLRTELQCNVKYTNWASTLSHGASLRGFVWDWSVQKLQNVGHEHWYLP